MDQGLDSKRRLNFLSIGLTVSKEIVCGSTAINLHRSFIASREIVVMGCLIKLILICTHLYSAIMVKMLLLLAKGNVMYRTYLEFSWKVSSYFCVLT